MKTLVLIVILAGCSNAGVSGKNGVNAGQPRTGTSASHADQTWIPDGQSAPPADAPASAAPATSPSGPALGQAQKITDQNRKSAQMFGGWGPHLRGLMRAPDGSLWFTADHNPAAEALDNDYLQYFHQTGGAWSAAGTLPHTAGIEQNSASVLANGYIYSYSINITAHALEECYFNTKGADKACNHVIQSLPDSTNYVGAALAPDGKRVAWWTTVGAAGSGGSFSYGYYDNAGWHGPITMELSGYNNFAYAFASFSDATHLSLGGQLYTGGYPSGSFSSGVVDIVIGSAGVLTPLWDKDGKPTMNVSDLWIDPKSKATHVVARMPDQHNLAYYFRAAGAPWSDASKAVSLIDGVYRARFAPAPDGGLRIVLGAASAKPGGIRVLTAAPDQLGAKLDLSSLPTVNAALPSNDFATPTAVYIESPAYQASPVGEGGFAFCGDYPAKDNEIWYVPFKP